MGRLAVVVLSLGSLVVGAAAFGAGPALTPESIQKYGAALDVPDGWASESVPPSTAVTHLGAIFRSPVSREGFTANMNLLIGKRGPNETLHHWLVGSSEAKYLQYGTLVPLTIHGVPALEYESSTLERIAGHNLLSIEYVLARGTRVYLFTYTALASDKGKYESTFKASAATIRFVATSPSD